MPRACMGGTLSRLFLCVTGDLRGRWAPVGGPRGFPETPPGGARKIGENLNRMHVFRSRPSAGEICTPRFVLRVRV